MMSPRMVGPIQRLHCALVPTSSSVGTNIEMPWFMMPGVEVGLGQLLGDDRKLEHVERQAGAAVLLRNGAGKKAVLKQQPLPFERLWARFLPAAARLRRQMAVLGSKGAQLTLQGEVVSE